MGWLEAINGLFSIINTVFRMLREKELRQMGYKKAKAEVEAQKAKTKEIADNIDNADDVADPWNGL